MTLITYGSIFQVHIMDGPPNGSWNLLKMMVIVFTCYKSGHIECVKMAHIINPFGFVYVQSKLEQRQSADRYVVDVTFHDNNIQSACCTCVAGWVFYSNNLTLLGNRAGKELNEIHLLISIKSDMIDIIE